MTVGIMNINNISNTASYEEVINLKKRPIGQISNPNSLEDRANHILAATFKPIAQIEEDWILDDWWDLIAIDELSTELEDLKKNLCDPECEKKLIRILKEKNHLFGNADLVEKIDRIFQELFKIFPYKTYAIVDTDKSTDLGRKIPRIEILPEANLEDKHTPLFFFPKSAVNLFFRPERAVKNKEEADNFVKTLANMEEIPWAYDRNGCQIRAVLACQILQYMGVPGSDLQKIWVTGNISYKSVSWVYHIAPVIKTKQGEEYVIDPSMNSSSAFTIEDWMKSMNGITKQGMIPSHQEFPPPFQTAPLDEDFDLDDRFLEKKIEKVQSYNQMYAYRFLTSLPSDSPLEKRIKEIFASKVSVF